MTFTKLASSALSSGLVAAMMMATPLMLTAQESHSEAKAQVEAHDAHHHNKAKIVGGSAAAGAVTGAAVAGPVGAVVGGGVGAVGGVVGNKARKHHSIKEREKYAKPDSY
jgi:hypothetical protein